MVTNRNSSHKYDNSSRNTLRPIALAITFVISSLLTNTAHADTYTVSNTNDAGANSLRDAIDQANNRAGADIILFSTPSGSVVNLSSNGLSISDELSIIGPEIGNPKGIIIDGGGLFRVMNNTFNKFTLENITLRNGSASFAGGLLSTGDVTLKYIHILNNSTTNGGGGGLFLHQDLSLNHALVSGNSTTGDDAKGGGVLVEGNATISHSKIIGNSTDGVRAKGGGLSVDGNLNLSQSNVSRNSSVGDDAKGGGIFVEGSATIGHSQIVGNSTDGEHAEGGGLSVAGILTLNRSSVSRNSTVNYLSSGGGVAANTINMTQSTISENSVADGWGGGLMITNSVNISQSTLSLNAASISGALKVSQDASIVIIESTIVNNSSTFASPGGIEITMINEDFDLSNSILANNTFNTIPSNFNNLQTPVNSVVNMINSIFGDSLSIITGIQSNVTETNAPLLGPLQYNGSMNKTHNPEYGFLLFSPVIDKIDIFLQGLPYDQRGIGFPRIDSSLKQDIGAVERQKNTNIDEVLSRRDMAREMLKAINVDPPHAGGVVYTDVKMGDINADWIEKFSINEYTEGCAIDKFCPDMIVTRGSMAKIFLKVKQGSNFTPTSMSNLFIDVSPASTNALWINELGDNVNFTSGCAANKFCPNEPVTRKWFNFLLTKL